MLRHHSEVTVGQTLDPGSARLVRDQSQFSEGFASLELGNLSENYFLLGFIVDGGSLNYPN